jgi:hypothetical protein
VWDSPSAEGTDEEESSKGRGCAAGLESQGERRDLKGQRRLRGLFSHWVIGDGEMQKWEYMEIRKMANKVTVMTRGGASEQVLQAASIEEKESRFLGYLDQLGQQGWELVSHIHWADGNVNVLMLKRPV